jgi:cytochrome c-type biogenesis protein CcmH/NrfG/predicted Ser/Thr protein kinase
MSEKRQCPKCGTQLSPETAEGMCPKCLMQAGLESQGVSAPGDVATGPYLAPNQSASPTIPPSPQFPTTYLKTLAHQFPQLDDFEHIGQGGMGVVYKARQRQLNRLVAVKILPPSVGEDPAFAERFTREAQALARLNHPHIVQVYDFGRTEDYFYFVMEYVDGVNLRALIRDAKLKPEEALRIVPQICEALQFAHDEGIVHRDIKPENILIDKKGRVKIADFGLAKLLGQRAEDWSLTGTGQLMGTLGYMAPEQLQEAHAVDHRADIYSLGVVFYEMLTGRLPIGKFEPPSKKVRVDVRLDEVVLHALENEPDRRYQHASEVKTDLEAMAQTGSSRDCGSSAGARSRPFSMLNASGSLPFLLAVAVTMVLSGLAVTAGIVMTVFAILTQPVGSGGFWGWMGGALGCIIGGGGSLAGCWNSYRQMEGHEDLMKSPDWTWLDQTLVGYTMLGVAAVVAGIVLHSSAGWTTTYSLLDLGGIVVFQGVLFLVIRGLTRRAALQKATTSRNADQWPISSLKIDAPRLSSRKVVTAAIGVFIIAAVLCAAFLVRSSVVDTESRKSARLTAEGWQLWNRQAIEPAAQKFDEATKLDPNNADAWNGLGWVSFNTGKADAAVKAFKTTVSLDPNHPGALNGLGQIALSQRKYDQAEGYLLAASPQASAAWFGLARLYLLTGNYDQAAKWSRKIIATGEADQAVKEILNAAQARTIPAELRERLEPTATPATDEASHEPASRKFIFGPGGPELIASAARFWLRPDQVAPVNKVLQESFHAYVAVEKQKMEQSRDREGHLISIIRPFPGELETLEGQLWSRLDSILDHEQQRTFRLNLQVVPREVHAGKSLEEIVRPGLFGWGTEGARVEVWREGTWFRWKVRIGRYEHTATAPQLPSEYARFWKESEKKTQAPSSS